MGNPGFSSDPLINLIFNLCSLQKRSHGHSAVMVHYAKQHIHIAARAKKALKELCRVQGRRR